MMMFWVMGFVIVLAVVVVVGLFYFMNKESGKAASGEAVPIMDISELKGLTPDQSKPESSKYLSASAPEAQGQSQDELSQAKSKLAELEGKHLNVQVPDETIFGPQDYAQPVSSPGDVHTLKSADAVSSGPLAERIADLESQITMITQKSIEQAEESVKVIESLMKENAQLKMNQSAMPSGAQDAASFVELKEQKALLENQLDLSNSKVSQLESQVAVIKKELGQQLIEANSTIARLKAEGEAQERIVQQSLLKEKEQLDELREANSKQLREMEDDLVKTKEENLLLKDAKKLLEAKLSVIEDDYKKELEQAKEVVNSLSNQKNEESEHVVQLEKDVVKLKELNGTLIDKAKILQYELNRYRAQASGLERVCANFKTQMEAMFGQVEQAKKENNRLIQDRINLESGVASLKSENVRLIERDKVYQQELEKTKEQINRFEKIYKNFKTDVGGVSDSA